jgi:hypothetical protein
VTPDVVKHTEFGGRFQLHRLTMASRILMLDRHIDVFDRRSRSGSELWRSRAETARLWIQLALFLPSAARMAGVSPTALAGRVRHFRFTRRAAPGRPSRAARPARVLRARRRLRRRLLDQIRLNSATPCPSNRRTAFVEVHLELRTVAAVPGVTSSDLRFHCSLVRIVCRC